MASYDVSDFTIEMNPDGDRVRLKVTSQIYPAGKDLGRWPLPQLDLEALRRLRQDEALPGDVAAVQQALATWLFDERLAAVLQAALAALAGNRRLRLVLSIAPPLWSALGELPFELLPWGNVPLLLHQRVASLVYVSPDAGSDAPLDSQTPLRILLVRSRPDDLDPVPEAAPLRDDWLALGRAGNSERPGVQVDLVSREPGALGPATWDVVRQRLKDTRYHLLVYLGHGEVTPSASGPTGALLFEAPPDSQGKVYNDPIAAAVLAPWLYNHPVPVVVLAGCLTAFEGAAEPTPTAGTMEAPGWARGNQGLAQTLINSQSGLRVCIGMRYNLTVQAAQTLLGALVKSLLQDEPGDVEAAVRAARLEMHTVYRTSPAWSAPAVFVAPGPPLVFPVTAASQATPPAPTPPPTTAGRSSPTHADAQDLYQRLLKYTDSEDLYDLAFRLGLDADELDTRTKSRFARDLLDHLDKQGRLDEFVQLLRREKPWVLR